MQLTQYADYSFRVLIYLARKTEGMSTVSEIAKFHDISRNHLVKVIHNLGTKGFISTTRGRNGGIKLSLPSSMINLGDVVRKTEPNFNIAECFNTELNCCVLTQNCDLKSIFYEAQVEFLKVFDKYTLADAVLRDKQTIKIISMPLSRKTPDTTPPQI